MKFWQEFKEFAVKGNVIDMAIGVIIGGAFGKIVTSLVNDVIMPPLGVLLNNVNFSDLKYVLSEAIMEGDTVVKPEAAIMYGQFIQTIIDFLIIALCIFSVIKGINTLKHQPKEEENPAPATPPEDILLLREIRDELKKQQK